MMKKLMQMDGWILLWLQENIRIPILTKLFTFITKLGDVGFVWIFICIVMLLQKKNRKTGIMGICAILCSFGVNNLILKNLVGRSRPFDRISNLIPLIEKPVDMSFPSGHTACSFAVSVLIYRHLPKCYGIPALILAFLISFSRVYLGVHYPSDVLFGMFSGSCMALAGEKFVEHQMQEK